LCAFAGREIHAGNLEDAAKFLAGPCSCQVKELNPGIDILMAADWESVVEGREAVVARVGRISIPEPKIAGGAATKPVNAPVMQQGYGGTYSVSQNPDGSVAFSYSMNNRTMLKVTIGTMTLVVVVLGLVLLLRHRRARR